MDTQRSATPHPLSSSAVRALNGLSPAIHDQLAAESAQCPGRGDGGGPIGPQWPPSGAFPEAAQSVCLIIPATGRTPMIL